MWEEKVKMSNVKKEWRSQGETRNVGSWFLAVPAKSREGSAVEGTHSLGPKRLQLCPSALARDGTEVHSDRVWGLPLLVQFFW